MCSITNVFHVDFRPKYSATARFLRLGLSAAPLMPVWLSLSVWKRRTFWHACSSSTCRDIDTDTSFAVYQRTAWIFFPLQVASKPKLRAGGRTSKVVGGTFAKIDTFFGGFPISMWLVAAWVLRRLFQVDDWFLVFIDDAKLECSWNAHAIHLFFNISSFFRHDVSTLLLCSVILFYENRRCFWDQICRSFQLGVGFSLINHKHNTVEENDD